MASLSSKPCRHCSSAAGMCQPAEVHMQPAEAGEVMHSRKEPCWVSWYAEICPQEVLHERPDTER